MDTRLVFFKNLVMHGYVAKVALRGSRAEHRISAAMVLTYLTYTTNWLGFVARHNKVGANFLPEAGFIERVDAKQDEAGLSLGLSLSPRPKIR